jgi:Arc/MetJ-type ribon-helix-helix transcriptional regulator
MDPQSEIILSSLPPRLRNYVERMAAAGQYSDAADYLKSLVREDLERRSQLCLENLVLASLNDDRPPREESSAFWSELEAELAELKPEKSKR